MNKKIIKLCEDGDLKGLMQLGPLRGHDLHKDENGYYPLGWACYRGHLGVVKYLIEECGANPHLPDLRDRTPLMDAVDKACNIDVVRYLIIKCKVDVNHYNGYCLVRACEKGSLGVVRLLIEYGRARVHHKDLLKVVCLQRPFNANLLRYLLRVVRLDPHGLDFNPGLPPDAYAPIYWKIMHIVLENTGPGSWVPPPWKGA